MKGDVHMGTAITACSILYQTRLSRYLQFLTSGHADFEG